MRSDDRSHHQPTLVGIIDREQVRAAADDRRPIRSKKGPPMNAVTYAPRLAPEQVSLALASEPIVAAEIAINDKFVHPGAIGLAMGGFALFIDRASAQAPPWRRSRWMFRWRSSSWQRCWWACGASGSSTAVSAPLRPKPSPPPDDQPLFLGPCGQRGTDLAWVWTRPGRGTRTDMAPACRAASGTTLSAYLADTVTGVWLVENIMSRPME